MGVQVGALGTPTFFIQLVRYSSLHHKQEVALSTSLVPAAPDHVSLTSLWQSDS